MFHEGKQIGSYTLISKLGKGGFGEVWLAEKRSQFVTKKVAVKLPLDEQVNFEAIQKEAELWEQASGHANVLPIIDADIVDGQVLIVSEYADGGSLENKLKREGKFPVKEAVEMTIGILNGLEFLHNRQIIHRDIKPANILLQGDNPRLADFGISRAIQTTAISSTIIGTDAYMSPEAFEGKRSVQTDIWSVGVLFYQLLTGRLPFPQEHPTERMFAVLMKDFELLPNYIPSDLQEIIRKALAKDPNERFQSAAQMRDELKKNLYGQGSSAAITDIFPQNTLPLSEITQSLPTVEEKSIPKTIQQNSTVSLSQSEKLADKFQSVQTRKGQRNLFSLKFAVVVASLVLLFGTVLTVVGYFAYQKIVSVAPAEEGSTKIDPAEKGLTNLTKEDMEIIFKDASPESLKRLAENPELKKKQIEEIKQFLAIAEEARSSGYADKEEIKKDLEEIRLTVTATSYDGEKNKDKKDLPPFSTITKETVDAYMAKDGNREKFDKSIKEQIEKAKKDGKIADNFELQPEQLAQAKEQYAKVRISFEQAKNDWSNMGEEFKRRTELQIKLQQAQYLGQNYSKDEIAPKIKATDAEVEKYLAEHPEEAKVLNEKKAKAEEILKRALAGEDFAKLAAENTDDPGSKKSGGLYKDLAKGAMVPEFEQAALALQPGQITDKLIESKYGYHIIKLERKGFTKDKDGKEQETYDARHILISTMIKDTKNSSSNGTSFEETVKTKIEEEKQKRILDDLIAKHKITVAEDFSVPQNSKAVSPTTPTRN